MMTRKEFIDLQIGACEARIVKATNLERWYRDQRQCSPEKLAIAFITGETTAANNKQMNQAERDYWRSTP